MHRRRWRAASHACGPALVENIVSGRFALHRNMRAELDPAFAALCLVVGDGTLDNQTRDADWDTMATSAIELPHALFDASTDTPDKLFQWVYEGTLG